MKNLLVIIVVIVALFIIYQKDKSSSNLINNGSFEEGDKFWKYPVENTGGIKPKIGRSNSNGAYVEFEREDYIGGFSQKISFGPSGNKKMIVTAWTKSKYDAVGHINVEVFDSKMGKANEPYGVVKNIGAAGNKSSDEWEKIELEIPLPSGADEALIYCSAKLLDKTKVTGDEKYQIFFDDVSVMIK